MVSHTDKQNYTTAWYQQQNFIFSVILVASRNILFPMKPRLKRLSIQIWTFCFMYLNVLKLWSCAVVTTVQNNYCVCIINWKKLLLIHDVPKVRNITNANKRYIIRTCYKNLQSSKKVSLEPGVQTPYIRNLRSEFEK